MAAVVSINTSIKTGPQVRLASWRLLELAAPGQSVKPLGIVLVDQTTDQFYVRLRDSAAFQDLEEQEIDLLDALGQDLETKGQELGGRAVLASMEEFSGFLRTTDCAEIVCRGGAARTADRLFDEYVDSEVRRWVTHVPVYALRAAATKFGESMNANPEGGDAQWVRAPRGTRLEPGMFTAQVVGRSMEPLIPDGSFCLFRTPVTGSRQGRKLLIEQFSETDFAARYTVKKYTSVKRQTSEEDWEHERIRLEPLNREFPAFDLGPDQFRVIAEFIAVLHAAEVPES
jgi:phage repressor protein C with HTH and peptisase S24 domain